MAKDSRKSRFTQSSIPALAALFASGYVRDDAPAVELWRRHDEGDIDADHALFEHYAPLAYVNALLLKRNRPTLFTDPIDDLISDACLGLLDAIDRNKLGVRVFRKFAQMKIRRRMYREVKVRRWGRECGFDETSIISRERGKLTAELGRVPYAEELTQRLRGLITNPNLLIHGDRSIYSESQLGDEDRPMSDPSVNCPPDQPAIDAETVRLAQKGLKPQDRKILKAVMRGFTPTEISRRYGISNSCARDRINGVLWLCRCNADLARHLGFEPQTMPAPNAKGKFPHLSIRTFLKAVG